MKNQSDGRRVARVEQEVQKTIAQYLISGIRRPLKGLVTVSRVIMPADLRTAKVYVSVLGSDEDRQSTVDLLQDCAFEIQHFIGKELRMRYCPKLSFFTDHTTDQVMKIDRILADLKDGKDSELQNEVNCEEGSEE